MGSTTNSDGPDLLDFDDFKDRYQKVPVEEYPNRVVETMPDPMVSVHVSTYQHADFIRDCLDGVLMQETDFPFEVIIGEDESDDGTREICKEYADRHPEKIRLFLHRRENNISIHGQPTGRFQNIYSKFRCRGRYIAVCEGDDYWRDERKLEKQICLLEKEKEYVLSHHDAIVINKSGVEVEKSHIPNENKKDMGGGELMEGPWLIYPSLCWRNVIERYPKEFFSSPFGDRFLVSLLGEHGKAKYHREVKKSSRRIHEGGAWSSKSRLGQIKGKIEGYEKIYNYHVGKRKVKSNIKKRINNLKKKMYMMKKVKYGRGVKGYIIMSKKIIKKEGILFFINFLIRFLRIKKENT